MASRTQADAKRSPSSNRDQRRPRTQADAKRAPTKPSAQVSTITLPLVHTRAVPEHLAYYGALGVLAALELVEWPLAAVLVVGHVLADRAHRRIVREIATGVDEAV